jgi:hypothetical protein
MPSRLAILAQGELTLKHSSRHFLMNYYWSGRDKFLIKDSQTLSRPGKSLEKRLKESLIIEEMTVICTGIKVDSLIIDCEWISGKKDE